ncbi:hypothetical protein GCM10020331_043590 [Ectobacillus funiculus]
MMGLELVVNRDAKEAYDWSERIGVRVCRRARELGMLIRPLGNVIVFMPPLAATTEELDAMLQIFAPSHSRGNGRVMWSKELAEIKEAGLYRQLRTVDVVDDGGYALVNGKNAHACF